MKRNRILLALSFVLFSSLAFSQNTFENKFYTSEESEFRFVKETSNGDFILLYHSINESDCIIKLSSTGDSLNTLCHQIPEAHIYFFGLFDHPEYEDSYIAPAIISNNSLCFNQICKRNICNIFSCKRQQAPAIRFTKC